MNEILPLENPIMEYAWGSRIHIPKLRGNPIPAEKPQAELWMGAHPKAPSRVGNATLLEMIEADPQGMLGKATAKRFNGRLPFLFKLLAADTPLSIQTHPNREQAAIGFAAENAAGLALDAPNRNYRDDNHKPEILCALTEFWALNGFRELAQMLGLLEEAGLRILRPELDALHMSPNRDGLRSFFRAIVELDDARKKPLLEELVGRARELDSQRPEYRWIVEIADLYPGDIGVLCVLLLNLVKLEPGQAMFCEAGDLHAYLDGFAVELMANSDNVLRGGLTPKHVDIPELMKTLTFRDGPAELIEPVDGRYVTRAEEFVLSVCEAGAVAELRPSPGFEIVISVAGEAAIALTDGSGKLALPQGTSAAIPARIDSCLVRGPATLYIAGVPTR